MTQPSSAHVGTDGAQGAVHATERVSHRRVLGARGATMWFTGLSGSGKSSIADLVADCLLRSGIAALRLDGDRLRRGLNADLGFTRNDRVENVRRVAHIACLLADAGIVAVVSLISPYAEGRRHARQLHEEAGLDFLEVFVATPLEECERRDPKGLYALSRAGSLTGFTGVDDPYEPPEHPELALIDPSVGVEGSAELALGLLANRLDRGPSTGGAPPEGR